jgi:hypothetical protein
MKKALSTLVICLFWAGIGALLFWMKASSPVQGTGEAYGFIVFLFIIPGAFGVLISGLWVLIELSIIVGSAVVNHRVIRTAKPAV